MSLAYMPFYFGDYLRDTGHLNTEQHGAYFLLIGHCWEHGSIPLDDTQRAAITKLTLKRWQAVKAPVERFFNPDGTHKRVTKERAKAEQLTTARQVAGSRGGMRAAAARAKQNSSKATSKAQAPPQQTRSKTQAKVVANMQQNSSTAQAYQNQKDSSFLESESGAARATPANPPQEQDNPAGSLATALGGSALTRPPGAEPEPPTLPPPSQATRADIEEGIRRRREREAAEVAERRRHVWGRGQTKPDATEPEPKAP